MVWCDRYFEMTDAFLQQQEEGVCFWTSRSSTPSFFFSCLSSSIRDSYVSLGNLNNPHYLGTLDVHILIIWVCEVQNERFRMKGGSD